MICGAAMNDPTSTSTDASAANPSTDAGMTVHTRPVRSRCDINARIRTKPKVSAPTVAPVTSHSAGLSSGRPGSTGVSDHGIARSDCIGHTFGPMNAKAAATDAAIPPNTPISRDSRFAWPSLPTRPSSTTSTTSSAEPTPASAPKWCVHFDGVSHNATRTATTEPSSTGRSTSPVHRCTCRIAHAPVMSTAVMTRNTAMRLPEAPQMIVLSRLVYRSISWYQPRLGPNSLWMAVACRTPLRVESANIATSPTVPRHPTSTTRVGTLIQRGSTPCCTSTRPMRGANTSTVTSALTPVGVTATVRPVRNAATPSQKCGSRVRVIFSNAATSADVPSATNGSGRMPSPNGSQQARKNTAVSRCSGRRRVSLHSGATMPRLTMIQVSSPARTLGRRSQAGARLSCDTQRIRCWTSVNGVSEALNQR